MYQIEVHVHITEEHTRVIRGKFTSVVSYRDKIYAAQCSEGDGLSSIHVLRYYNNQWVFLPPFTVGGGWNSLSVKNNQLKCCSRDDRNLYVYSLEGQLIETRAMSGSGDASHPCIGDDDDDGSMLIAELCDPGLFKLWYHKLQVMTDEGKITTFRVSLQTLVSRPQSALLFHNHLYVLSKCLTSSKIFKYSFE